MGHIYFSATLPWVVKNEFFLGQTEHSGAGTYGEWTVELIAIIVG